LIILEIKYQDKLVIESEITEEDEMNLFTSLQTETNKDVNINPELTEKHKCEIMEVLEGCFY